MTAFEFLNMRNIVEKAFKDKRKGNNKTAYRRFMEMKRGLRPIIEEHELKAFYEQYELEDKSFRAAMDNLIKTANKFKS